MTQALLTDATPLLVRTPEEIRAEIRRALEARREAVAKADADEVRRIDIHVAAYHWLLGDTDVAPYTGRRVPVLDHPATWRSSSPTGRARRAEHPPLRRPGVSSRGGLRRHLLGAWPARRPAVGLLELRPEREILRAGDAVMSRSRHRVAAGSAVQRDPATCGRLGYGRPGGAVGVRVAASPWSAWG